MKTRIITATLCAIVALMACSCGNRGAKNTDSSKDAAALKAKADSVEAAAKEQRTMDKLSALPDEPVFDMITNYGTIKIKLFSNTPKHRENFAKLALGGFYDGLLFHRVINGFMIQGGDPLTKDESNADRFGTGGPGYTVPAEFVKDNTHRKGAIAAARRGDAANPLKESSGSQFYIVQDERTCAQLDGQYTVFGQTIEGLDVIDKIAAVQTDYRDRPLTPVKIIAVKVAE